MADSPKENKKPAQDNDFDKRHEKELGVGRFVTVSGLNILIPLGSAAAAGVLGYLTLGKPIKAMFPRAMKWGSDAPALVKAIRGFKTDNWKELWSKIEEAGAASFENIRKTDPGFEVNTIDSAIKVINSANEQEVEAIRKVLGMPEPDALKTAKWVGAGVGGFLGSMFGGMAVNYNEWRKDESARLAAEEVNKNISQMEIFKPSDPELVAENKRLRAMLAEKDPDAPKVSIHAAKSDGKIASVNTEVAVG